MVTNDVSGSIVTPDIRGRGVLVGFAILSVEFVLIFGLVLAVLGLSQVPALLWALPAVLYPALIGWVVHRRYRALARTAASAASEGTEHVVLFSSAAVAAEVRADGVMTGGLVIGPGWLSVGESTLRVCELAQPLQPRLETAVADVVAIETVRVWKAVFFEPLLRVRLHDGGAIDLAPCAPGFGGFFGYSRSRLERTVRDLESTTIRSPGHSE